MKRTKKPQKKRSLNRSKKPGPKCSCTREICDQAYKFALLGLNNKQMAHYWGKDVTTVSYWYREKPMFRQAIDKGRHYANAELAYSMHQAGNGYEHPAVKFFKIPHEEEEYDEEGNVIKRTKTYKIKKVPYVKKYKPDTRAGLKILGIKMRETWGESYKVEHKHSHMFAGDVNIHHILEQISDAEMFTDEELKVAAKLGLDKATKEITNGQN